MFTPRSVCRRIPAHGLYFRVVNTMHMCASSASTNEYHHVNLRGGSNSSPNSHKEHLPTHCLPEDGTHPSVTPTSGLPPVCVGIPPLESHLVCSIICTLVRTCTLSIMSDHLSHTKFTHSTQDNSASKSISVYFQTCKLV